MKLYHELTTEEQRDRWKERCKRQGWRNLWLECESESLKVVIRDQKKQIDTLYELLLENFQKDAEKFKKD